MSDDEIKNELEVTSRACEVPCRNWRNNLSFWHYLRTQLQKIDLLQLESIKKLLVLQLIWNGISYVDVAKDARISTKTLYKFVPKTKLKEE